MNCAPSASDKPRLEEAASDLSQVAPERYSQMDLDDDCALWLYEGEHGLLFRGEEESSSVPEAERRR